MKLSLVDHSKSADLRGRLVVILGVTLLGVVVILGRTTLNTTTSPIRLVVYALSTQEEVLTQGIFPAFERAWETERGQDLTIEGVFGPSGTLAGQLNLGAPADVAVFSSAQHVTWLKIGRRVRQETEAAVIGRSPIVIVTRPGNPAGLYDLADLAQPGLRILHADPQTSGAGQWAVLAEYGNALLSAPDPGSNRTTAEAQLKAIWRNVRLLGPSARASMTLFELGAGDALVTYEQDARLALERGVALHIVAPPCTIVAHHVAVLVDDNVTEAERPAAQALIDFLLSDAGQEILGLYHLRPIVLESELFPELTQPFTVEALGGWSQAYGQLVDTLWQAEIEPRLELEPGPLRLRAGDG